MPLNEVHKKKKSKNYALLAIVVSLMLLFFAVTIVKIKEVNSHVTTQSGKE
ncbi:MAG: hypothetical protein K0R98_614 [Rickettsiaceae bacterium]|jgi:hypothetical protein|nr:hypothetical protein [Rickettsiaceae bacterium]